jgi:hypothetical protein
MLVDNGMSNVTWSVECSMSTVIGKSAGSYHSNDACLLRYMSELETT